MGKKKFRDLRLFNVVYEALKNYLTSKVNFKKQRRLCQSGSLELKTEEDRGLQGYKIDLRLCKNTKQETLLIQEKLLSFPSDFSPMLLQFQISKEFCCSLTFLVFKRLRTLEYSYVKSQLLDKINVKNVVLCTLVIFEMVLFTN